MSARRTAFFVTAAIVVACNGILGIEDRELRGTGTDIEAGPKPEASVEDGPTATDAGDAADGYDPFDAGPGLVVIVPGPKGYAIDSREVTVAEYAGFLADGGGDSGSIYCDWKTTNALEPGCTPNTQSAQPIVCIDWCDALAYCKSVGKRLCGRRGGGEQTVPEFPNPATDEWTFACAGSLDADRWCYGTMADPAKCNTTALEAGAMTAPGSLPGCVGGKPGIFDMSGNASEWEDSCLTDSGLHQDQGCAFRGGAARNAIIDSKCNMGTFLPRSTGAQDVGIRCCKDL